MNTSFTIINQNMDTLVSTYGFYKTANVISEAFERDTITEAQGCSLRFMLAMKYERTIRKCGDHLLGIESLDLDTPVVETNKDAMLNRRRTDCVFDKTVNGTPDAMFYGI